MLCFQRGVIDTIHDRSVSVWGGRRNQNFVRAALEVGACCFVRGEMSAAIHKQYQHLVFPKECSKEHVLQNF